MHGGHAGAIASIRRTWPDADGKVHPGTDWAGGGDFGQLVYSTYSTQYFKDWGDRYHPVGEAWYDIPWMRYDYGKPGADEFAKDRTAMPEVASVNLYTGEYDAQVVRVRVSPAGWSAAVHPVMLDLAMSQLEV